MQGGKAEGGGGRIASSGAPNGYRVDEIPTNSTPSSDADGPADNGEGEGQGKEWQQATEGRSGPGKYDRRASRVISHDCCIRAPRRVRAPSIEADPIGKPRVIQPAQKM